MNNLGIGMGIPCPNCNPDGKDPDKNKRIAASLVSILATRSASCRYCGFVMEMD